MAGKPKKAELEQRVQELEAQLRAIGARPGVFRGEYVTVPRPKRGEGLEVLEEAIQRMLDYGHHLDAMENYGPGVHYAMIEDYNGDLPPGFAGFVVEYSWNCEGESVVLNWWPAVHIPRS